MRETADVLLRNTVARALSNPRRAYARRSWSSARRPYVQRRPHVPMCGIVLAGAVANHGGLTPAALGARCWFLNRYVCAVADAFAVHGGGCSRSAFGRATGGWRGSSRGRIRGQHVNYLERLGEGVRVAGRLCMEHSVGRRNQCGVRLRWRPRARGTKSWRPGKPLKASRIVV